MGKEKLDRANFLQKEIRKINSLIKDIYDDFEIKVQSNNTTWYISENIHDNSQNKDDFVAMLTKWRNEYEKEFEEL